MSSSGISSKQIHEDLTQFMSCNKTHDLKFPQNILYINNNYLFCRGYFDGDGSWCVKDNGQIQFKICGTKAFLIMFNKLLISGTNINRKPEDNIYKQGGIYILAYGGRKLAKSIASWMYQDILNGHQNAPYMLRKFTKIRFLFE